MTKSKKKGRVRRCFAQIYAQVTKLTPTRVTRKFIPDKDNGGKKSAVQIVNEKSKENIFF